MLLTILSRQIDTSLQLQVTMSSAASPDKLYVRAVMPLSTTVLRRLHPSTPVISSPKPTAQAFKTWEGEVELPGLPPLEQLEMRLGIVVLCPDGEVVALGEESSGLAIAATSLHEESKSGGS